MSNAQCAHTPVSMAVIRKAEAVEVAAGVVKGNPHILLQMHIISDMWKIIRKSIIMIDIDLPIILAFISKGKTISVLKEWLCFCVHCSRQGHPYIKSIMVWTY